MNYKLYSFEEIPSTQEYAHELIASGTATDRAVIIAGAQSAGRGRYRRTWISKPGNLYASFIYKIEKREPRLSYAVAVAIAETMISFGIDPKIKWPNDILIDGKKVSGTLIEYSKDFVIVGIGVNIKSNPVVAGYETTKLDRYKRGITRDKFLVALMDRLDEWAAHLSRGDFAPVRARWMELAAGLDSEIKYQGKPAILCEINPDGALVLRRGNDYILALGDEISI
ncbi:MAG: biotin--[acetyl-CoA-carboxylase] ligase [Alphaproteobacteria bacterium]|nr:biotin--[acetyl-CoA-carboxylase] ligase [Alphaproteobacteria bacterium]MCL2757927.1 biotin--[acetyl-CoA-carboxylase] ligase [Alphaproteobacteria bacterium]